MKKQPTKTPPKKKVAESGKTTEGEDYVLNSFGRRMIGKRKPLGGTIKDMMTVYKDAPHYRRENILDHLQLMIVLEESMVTISDKLKLLDLWDKIGTDTDWLTAVSERMGGKIKEKATELLNKRTKIGSIKAENVSELNMNEVKILSVLYEAYIPYRSHQSFSSSQLELATKLKRNQLNYSLRKLREKDFILSIKGTSYYKGISHRLSTKGLNYIKKAYKT